MSHPPQLQVSRKPHISHLARVDDGGRRLLGAPIRVIVSVLVVVARSALTPACIVGSHSHLAVVKRSSAAPLADVITKASRQALVVRGPKDKD